MVTSTAEAAEIGTAPHEAEVKVAMNRRDRWQSSDADDLVAAWHRWANAAGPPHRADLRFEELGPIAAQLFLLEPVHGGADWRYSMVGNEVAAWFGGDVTGYTLAELYTPDQMSDQASSYRKVAALQKIHVTEGRIEGEDIHPLRFEVVHLPIRAGRPDNPQIWILGGIFFLD